MTFEQDIANFERLYGVSWYAEVDRIDVSRIAPIGASESAMRELGEPGALVTAMEENVREAIGNRDGVRARYEDAQRDGLFDLRDFKGLSEKLQQRWAAVIETQTSDRSRCVAELRHWRGYRDWARSQERIADRRLPPEREEAAE